MTDSAVRIRQRGRMRLRSGGRALRFTAEQWLAADRVAFEWRARFGLLRVVDRYDGAAGELAVRLLGLPVQRQRGPETTTGEALRYLAELPFVPLARARNDELEWRRLDERRSEVATTVAGERLAVELEADEAGDVVRASSRQRLLKRDGKWRATPWGGEFGDYAELGGLRLPGRVEAYWDLPEGRFVYFSAQVVDAAATC